MAVSGILRFLVAAAQKQIPIIPKLILLVVGTLAGFLISEVGFRSYLYFIDRPSAFVRPVPEAYQVFDRPTWVYDEDLGYRYQRDRVHASIVIKGRVTACSFYDRIYRLGQVTSDKVGPKQQGELRVLVLGDSFTAQIHDGVFWTDLLEDRLTGALGRRVQVINLGRDGTGILQFFDYAADRMEEFEADLMVFAFINPDLNRVRFWPTVMKVGGHWRFLVSFEATPAPDPDQAYDVALYHPEATPEWCNSMRGRNQGDRVTREIEEAYQQGVAAGGRRHANVFTLAHSYLITRLIDGDPFFGTQDIFDPRRYSYIPPRYEEDSRFVENLRKIDNSGVPYFLVRLFHYSDNRIREKDIPQSQRGFIDSLRNITGKKIHDMTSFVAETGVAPDELIISPEDYHPSMKGLELYAEFVAKILLQSGDLSS